MPHNGRRRERERREREILSTTNRNRARRESKEGMQLKRTLVAALYAA
jgi:hypothetical protein